MSELIEKRNARLLKAQAEAAAKKAAEEASRGKPAAEITWECAECGSNRVKRKGAICPECKAKHKATASEPVKILDTSVLEPLFLEIKKRKHNNALGLHMFRNKGFDKAAAADFMDLYRKLKREGYQ